MTNLTLYYRLCDAVKEYFSKKYRDLDKKQMEEYADADIFKLSVKVYSCKEFDEIRELIKKRGWKSFSEEELKEVQMNVFKFDVGKTDPLGFQCELDRGLPKVYNRTFNVIYNREHDKIAINFRDKGFAYNFNARRYYPLNISEPVLTKTNKFWYFKRPKKGKKLQVREFKINHTLPDVLEYAIRKVFNMTEVEDEYDISFYTYANDEEYGAPDLLFRRVLENRDLMQVIEESHKTSLPKAIKRQVHISDLPNLARIVNSEDYNKLCQALSKDWQDVTEIALENLIMSVYHNQFDEKDASRLSGWLIGDIIREHIMLSRKLNLKIKSFKRLIDIHNECSTLLRNNYDSNISVKKKFLKCFNGFQGDYELITTRSRLNQEGKQMNHCVASYGDRINRGDCCIVSILWTDGHRYTAEIRQYSESKRFYIEQLQGYKNCIHGKPPQELYDKILNECGITDGIPKINNQPEIIPVLQEI